MIDRTARERALELLERWHAGTLTNLELEDTWPESNDRGVRAVGDRLWCFYSDFPKATSDLSSFGSEDKDLFDRCMKFLQSEAEYGWPDFDFQREGLRPIETLFRGERTKVQRWGEFTRAGDIAWWPFLDQADSERHRR